jgi:hypothetical protein
MMLDFIEQSYLMAELNPSTRTEIQCAEHVIQIDDEILPPYQRFPPRHSSLSSSSIPLQAAPIKNNKNKRYEKTKTLFRFISNFFLVYLLIIIIIFPEQYTLLLIWCTIAINETIYLTLKFSFHGIHRELQNWKTLSICIKIIVYSLLILISWKQIE